MRLLIWAELRKLLLARAFWVAMAVTFAILGVYAYQYTLNPANGAILAQFRDPSMLASALLLAYAVLYSLPVGVVAGGFLAGQEYANSTQGPLVVAAGRLRPLLAKMIVAVLAMGLVSVGVVLFSLVWDAVVAGAGGYRVAQILLQLVVAWGVSSVTALVPMALAVVTRSATKGITICLIVWVGVIMVLSGPVPQTMYLLPVFYWTDLIARCFSNLGPVQESLGAAMPKGAPHGWAAASLILVYVLLCAGVAVVVTWRREYHD